MSAVPRLILRLQVDAKVAFHVAAGADQDELGALIVQQARVLGSEAAVTEFLLELFRVIGLLRASKPVLRGDPFSGS